MVCLSLSLSLSLMFSEGQELPVDMETINLDRDAEVMPPARLSLGVQWRATLSRYLL